MELTLETRPLAAIDAAALAIVAFARDEKQPALSGFAQEADQLTGGLVEELYATREFSGKLAETALLHRPAGFAARRLLLVGGGKPEKFGPAELRSAAGAALRALKSKGVRDICFLVDPNYISKPAVEAAAEGALLGDFTPDAYKTDPKKAAQAVDQFRIIVPDASPAWTDSLRRGRIVAEAQNLARTLISEPSNRLTPSGLAAAARAVAAESGLECDVLDRGRLEQLGMGALLGVARGSAEPPALIVLRYKPAVANAKGHHLALIGKGVTFDSGGISIKPSEGMEKMKYDMAGAASVIAAMRAIAQFAPPLAVTAFAPVVENMPGSRAQRPGDIVTSLSGKTIEVLNTDAEGRLILADALTYAIRQGATHLVDAATLTGAIAVALAGVQAGLFSNHDGLQGAVAEAARQGGERFWPLPMDDEYREMLKSDFADVPNITGVRYGGAITAAKFLEEFVEEKPWAHLDIAGTAWLEESKPFLAKGPTGIGVRTFIRLACHWPL